MLTNSIFSRSKKRIPSLAIAVAAFGAVSLGSMIAAKPTFAQAAATQYGLVDNARIIRESKTSQQVTADLKKLQDSLNGVLRRLQGSAQFLSPAEINELADLYQKEKPTEAETKRIGTLEEKGDKLKREMDTLQTATTLTEVQTARREALNDTVSQAGVTLKSLQTSFNSILSERLQDADRKNQATIRASVTKIAKEKNLLAVFSSEVAVYADVDITDDVIKDLNK